jgi:hypothetical protein
MRVTKNINITNYVYIYEAKEYGFVFFFNLFITAFILIIRFKFLNYRN